MCVTCTDAWCQDPVDRVFQAIKDRIPVNGLNTTIIGTLHPVWLLTNIHPCPVYRSYACHSDILFLTRATCAVV
jgi:hypothetical protein